MTFLLGALFLTKFSLAQGEANFWYFGYNVGLDFTGGSPEAVTNSKMALGAYLPLQAMFAEEIVSLRFL